MTAFKNDGVLVQEYVYDFSVHGGAQAAIEISTANSRLPVGSIIKDVHFWVETAIDGTSSTLAAGNGTTADAYHVATAEATLAINYVGSASRNKGASLWDDTNDNLIPYRVADADKSKFMVTIATGDLTAGKVHYMVEYFNPSR